MAKKSYFFSSERELITSQSFYGLTHAQCASTTAVGWFTVDCGIFVLQRCLCYVHFQFLYPAIYLSFYLTISLSVSSFALCRTRMRPFSCDPVARSRFAEHNLKPAVGLEQKPKRCYYFGSTSP